MSYYIYQFRFSFGVIYTCFFVITIIVSVLFRLKLKNPEPNFLPSVSIVIPVKNEPNFHRTIEAIIQNKYPQDKLEILAVGNVNREITAQFPQVTVYNKTFKDKRNAIAYGIRKAWGDIIVRVDSDTKLKPNAIKHIVKPFQRCDVGAVSGVLFVGNHDKNLLTAFQSLLYFYAFSVSRILESTFGTLTTISGGFCALRKNAVLPFLDEWENHKPSIGEDGHMSLFILKSGYKTFLAHDAYSETIVPETLTDFFKQQIRWTKGFLLNKLRGFSFMWRKGVGGLIFYAKYVLTICLPYFIVLNPHVTWIAILISILISIVKGTIFQMSTRKLCLYLFLFPLLVIPLNIIRVPIAFLTISEKTRGSTRNIMP